MQSIHYLLAAKKVLILGFGREGRSTLSFLTENYPHLDIGLADENTALEKEIKALDLKRQVQIHLGKDYLGIVNDYDLVIRSPGVSPFQEQLSKLKVDNKLTSATQIFFDLFGGKVIAVTGTKGKSTTTALIDKVLSTAGMKTELLGNIGRPVLDIFSLPNVADYAVVELSSHQLIDVNISPSISLITNLYTEHQDYYSSLEEYWSAKKNISINQTSEDLLITNPNCDEIKDFISQVKSEVWSILDKDIVEPGYGDIDTSPVYGVHKESVLFAWLVAKRLGINTDDFRRALLSFKGLPYRMEKVGTVEGVDYINDSLATIPEATIKALQTLGDKVQTLIVGGYDRGQDFRDLADLLVEKRGLHNLILLPETGAKIVRELDEHTYTLNLFEVNSIEEAVKIAANNTAFGKICLLSPAAASFNMFADYRERGDRFSKAVKDLIG